MGAGKAVKFSPTPLANGDSVEKAFAALGGQASRLHLSAKREKGIWTLFAPAALIQARRLRSQVAFVADGRSGSDRLACSLLLTGSYSEAESSESFAGCSSATHETNSLNQFSVGSAIWTPTRAVP